MDVASVGIRQGLNSVGAAAGCANLLIGLVLPSWPLELLGPQPFEPVERVEGVESRGGGINYRTWKYISAVAGTPRPWGRTRGTEGRCSHQCRSRLGPSPWQVSSKEWQVGARVLAGRGAGVACS